MFDKLDTIYEQAMGMKASDLVFTMHKLWTAEAFQFVAQHNRTGKKLDDDVKQVNLSVERSLITMEKKINEQSLIPAEPIANDLYHAAKSYHAAKLGLTSVGLAKKASEVMMAHLQSLKPVDMDIAKAQPNLRRASDGVSDVSDVPEGASMTNRGTVRIEMMAKQGPEKAMWRWRGHRPPLSQKWALMQAGKAQRGEELTCQI
ncbi:MAG: hypothetical protein BYD32DRAFT_89270 [Podila humilis]|nr:MAG: hypothetical protein BYD32DRAFT_89270 [Podila humilis]